MDRTREEREIVWLPKSLAKKVKDNTDEKLVEQEILKYLDDSRKDVRRSLEILEEDVVSYRALMVKARQSFEKAKNEQLDASYKLWEKFDKEMPKLSEKIKTLEEKLSPVKETVDGLEESLKNMSTYRIKDLVELIEKLDSILTAGGETGKMVRFLLKEYKA